MPHGCLASRPALSCQKARTPAKWTPCWAWAEVIQHGAKFDDARAHCELLAQKHGYRYIHSGNEPLLIAGVATETLEMLQDQPDLDAILVPVGGRSGAAGACARATQPQTLKFML